MTDSFTFKGERGEYKEVTTQDGSTTLWSSFFDENCHSLSGGKRETEHVYIEGCSIPERFKDKNELKILEIGFGAGLGMQTTLDYVRQHLPHCSLSFISLEIDWALISRGKEQLPCLRYAKTYQNAGANHLVAYDRIDQLAIVCGDALETLEKAINDPLLSSFFPVDAVFQDAFSPRKNPELWSAQWFEKIKKACHPKAQLSTYSSSKLVHKALEEAGLEVTQRPGLPPKKNITCAKLKHS